MPTCSFSLPQELQRRNLAAVWVTLGAGALGFLINLSPVSLGNELDFIFGGVPALIVAVAFRPVCGLAAGTLAALATIPLWQHNLAVPFFAAEAFAVGWLGQRRRWNLLVADAVFWAAISPFLYLVHVHTALYPDNLGPAVALKYVVNGLLCATLADVCLAAPRLGRKLAHYGANLPEDTLAVRLARLLTLAAVAPVCFLAVWYARTEARQRMVEVESELSVQSRWAADVVSDKVIEIRQSVALLADHLGTLWREPSAVEREVARFHAHHSTFRTVLVADAAGDVVFSRPFFPSDKPNVADETYFREALASCAPYVSEGFRGNNQGEPLVVFSAPIVVDNGPPQGVVAGAVPVSKLSLTPLVSYEQSVLVVVDQASRVLLTTRPDLFPPLAPSLLPVFQPKGRVTSLDLPAAPRATEKEGLFLNFWVWQAGVPETPWRCYTLLPFAAVRERAALVFVPVLVTIPFVLFLATWASSFTARLVMRPLRDLSEKARAIASTPDLLHEVKGVFTAGASHTPREIAELTEAFQTMAARLGETLGELRRTSIEREIARQRLEESREHLARELAARTAEIERREAIRLQSQKMEVLGRLTGGIAHNFNNLLTVILSYGSLALDRCGEDDRLRKSLTAVRRAAERGRDLIKQLMAYSRAGDANAATCFLLHDALCAVQGMVEKLLGEDVTLTVRFSAADVAVRAVPQELEQVFLNLLVNARDAMPKGGDIVLETALVTDAASETGGVWMPPNADLAALLATGRVVRVSVRDAGMGMPPDVMQRLGDPFFTTKPEGKGTGLGLSSVLGTVTAMGGFLRVESEVGRGSVFHVYLPTAEEPLQNGDAGAAPLSFVKPAEKSLRVLVAEDEPDVRAAVMQALQTAGFAVVEARNGAEALELVRRQAGRFDLVVSDVRMPHVNGVRLASAIWEQYPNLPVLFISGYTDKQDSGPTFAFRDNLLYKPFTAVEVIEKAISMVEKARQPEPDKVAPSGD